MSAQITGSTTFSLELVALAVGLSMLVGALDLIHQPQWAWKRAGENKAAYLVLVVLVPIVGLGLYLFRARPKVVAEASGHPAGPAVADSSVRVEPSGTSDPPPSLEGATASAGFREMATLNDDDDPSEAGATPLPPSEPVEISSTFFSSGTATRTRIRPYRPRQRTGLDESLDASPIVPAGWNVDPTDRHQFRYWDGFHWTENVADDGRQSRDQVSS
jgi:hypothetical protein